MVSIGGWRSIRDDSALRTAAQPLTTLSEDERLFRDSVYEFADREIRPLVREMDEQAKIPRRSSTSCSTWASWASRSRRATAAAAPRFFHSVLAVEALSRVDPSIGVLVDVQNTLVINALLRWGNDDIEAALPAEAGRRHDRRLRAVGGRLGQRRVRADDARAPSTATTGSLTGRKLWITNGNEADLFIVFANVNPEAGYRGITAFLVERGVRRVHASARRKTSSASAPAAPASCCSTTAACRAPTSSARSARATRSRSRR